MTMTFTGPDGVNTYRAAVLRSSIKLHKSTGMIPTRGVTITRMFKLATEYTGKTYKRGAHDAAIADLQEWLDANGTTGN